MKDILQWLKKIALFLLGVILIVWGDKVNANVSKNKSADTLDKNSEKLSLPEKVNAKEEKNVKDSVSNAETLKSNVSQPKKQETDIPVTKPSVEKTKKAETKKNTEEKKVESPENKTVIETSTTEEASGTE